MTDFDMADKEPLVQDICKALGDKVPADKVRAEVKKYLEYQLPDDSVRQAVIRKLGSTYNTDGGAVSGSAVTKKISELTGNEMSVTVVAKMVFVERKQITARGIPKTIISGIAGDDTATAPFTIWSDEGEYEKGKTYTFSNAYCKKFRDQVQLNIGNRGKVVPNDDVVFDHVARGGNSSAQEMAVGDITDETKNVTVTGILSEVAPRTINVKGEEKTIWGGMLSDASGRIQFTAWKDCQLKDGETVTVQNAYIRAWKGIPQLNIGDYTEVTRSDKQIENVQTGAVEKTVEEIIKVGGGLDISITGTIVDLRNGSGLIKRCPKCNRSVLNDECTIHGHIDPVPDLRLKATVDDGTGAISAVINREYTEKITDITLDQAEEIAKQESNMGAVADRMAAVVLLKKVTLKGNVMTDDFGPQMIVHSAEISNVDVEAEASKLYDEVEASL